ncbi:sirohydrochlorin cobaltochelatase [Methanothermococcus okinawensis IH1]|uniref:Sirohydrochlorin cobaltochelatase n=1 Tax=Methanothermococcus okinawensis (strain DSM 14208 / JCM 11175 / IH1) TaxID=647113 RepID=F8ALS2_METOI|nr:sirohydrochlorin cobaltochelatase [Methanothermococcus okinawensis IH1]
MEALVLIGHGSRLPYSKEIVSEIAEKIKEKTYTLL